MVNTLRGEYKLFSSLKVVPEARCTFQNLAIFCQVEVDNKQTCLQNFMMKEAIFSEMQATELSFEGKFCGKVIIIKRCKRSFSLYNKPVL